MVVLVVTTVLPSSGLLNSLPGLRQALQGMLCNAEETLNAEPFSTGMAGFGQYYGADFACVDAAGVSRSVNGQFNLLSAGVYSLFFVLGLLFSMMGIFRGTRKLVSAVGLSELTPTSSAPTKPTGTLAARLSALEDAYQKRQITAEEHQELRQKLLNQFTNE
ncbi:hypothetical protein VZO05_01230 [Aggregatilineales bacterium SYSU G02658]